MSYSKIHQEKYSYKCEINIKATKCPVCHKFNMRMSESGLISCSCGFILNNTHNYVAGRKLETNLDFKIEKIKKENGDE